MVALWFLIWIILNGKITVEITIFGLVISLLINWIMIRYLEYKPVGLKLIKKLHLVLYYIVILLRDIIVSNFLVIKFILSKDIQIQPQIVFFKVNFESDFAKTILANSITLAPGTITINVEKDVFIVHALDYTFAKDLENSKLIKILEEMEAK